MRVQSALGQHVGFPLAYNCLVACHEFLLNLEAAHVQIEKDL